MFRRTTASLFAATLAVGALVATAGASAPPYEGNQYDYGGTRTTIDGSVPVVDSIANSIAASGAQTVTSVEAARATMPYGGIDPGVEPDQLVTYPGPPGIAASDQYAVTVQRDGSPHASFTYKSLARKPDTNRSADTSWTSFSFRGSVTVAVEKQSGSATDCMVRPYSAGIVNGEIEQVIFRNIHAYTSYNKPNVVQGIDGNHKVKNINFQNVFANNECFASKVGGDFSLDPSSTNAIRIMRSKDGSCQT